ncbi:MAG: hypothetical protein GY801_25110, partial [bacterium]|nr:hypothetical protein [bacterium]
MPQQLIQHTSGARFFRYCGYSIFAFEILLGVAHLLWPEFRWGQGRLSYFNFANSLTLASWLASMQLAGVSLCSLIAFQRERHFDTRQTASWSSWLWLVGFVLALGLSFAEMTRFHHRFHLFGYPNPKLYHHFILFPAFLVVLFLCGVFLFSRQRMGPEPGTRTCIIGWLAAWGLERVLATLYSLADSVLQQWEALFYFFRGEAYLLGCTSLLLVVGTHAIQSEKFQQLPALSQPSRIFEDFLGSKTRLPILVAVAGTTAALIFFQIILFQLLNIFGDYLTANSVIAIAMLGMAMGGLIAAYGNSSFPRATLISATLLFPVSLLFAFGTAVSLAHSPFLASLLLMVPFLCGSIVITIVLARAQSHLVYFVDLIGAAVGTICVSSALWYFREESSLFFLASFASLVALCVILSCRFGIRFRRLLVSTALMGACLFATVGILNLRYDWFNIIRTKIRRSYPRAKIYFSRSSFGGRYDVILREPHHQSLGAYENGRITDTVRSRPAEQYRIDPRLPHTLIRDPSILIIGLSGDGIIKTSKFIGKHVTGVEINPAVVSLQTNELRDFNAASYQDVEVAVMDARSFLEQSQETYDMITLLNTHTSRGSAAGRAASPEYMDTHEAIESYLEHLTERGVVIFEEPVNRPRREPPIWKLLVTMRQVLLHQGSPAPERHVFIFQWRTKTNNYIQIVLKKNPLSDTDIAKLKQWLHDVDHIKSLEAIRGQKLGPIHCKTTLLHSPDLRLSTNYARILRGETTQHFLHARNLTITTDDRPFHFDVAPKHPELKAAYTRTLLMTLGIVPFLLLFFKNRHFEQRLVAIYVLAVILAGIGYFFIEVTLIQWFAFFLGTPVTTFSTVLGSLLFFSGLGSLWSGRIRHSGLYAAFALIPLLLLALLGGVPVLFRLATSWLLWQKVCLSILCLAPLAFCMGVPFPWILRSGKARFTASAAPILFGLNAAAGALAVPLSMNLATS